MKNRYGTGLLIFIFLSTIYALTYSGTFITDDEHILASRALSFAFDDEINDFRVYGNLRIHDYQELPDEFGTFGLNVEPLFPAVASILAKWSTIIGTGRIQTMFLANIWITAATGVMVYLSIVALGYSTNTAVITSLLFGLGTQAWPYSTSFFRDPLVGLLLLIAWTSIQLINRKNIKVGNYAPSKNIMYFLIAVLSLIAGIATKNSAVFLIPILIILLFQRPVIPTRVADRNKYPLKILRPAIIGILFASILGIWHSSVSSSGILARNSLEYYWLALNRIAGDSHDNFIQAVLGPIISPGKSIFLYSPVLILSLISLKKHFRFAWSAWVYAIGLIFAQALFYDDLWWGSINWGLRFFIPAIPMLMVSAAPIVESLTKTKSGRRWILLIAIIGVGIQLNGILVPLYQFYISNVDPNVPESIRNTIWAIGKSPIVWNFKYLFGQGAVDLMLLRIGQIGIVAILGFVVVATTSLAFQIFNKLQSIRPLLLVSIVMVMTVPFLAKNDPAYQEQVTEWPLWNSLESKMQNSKLVVIYPYGAHYWEYAMNWFPDNVSWASVPHKANTLDLISGKVEYLLGQSRNLKQFEDEDFLLVVETKLPQLETEIVNSMCSENKKSCLEIVFDKYLINFAIVSK